MKDTFIRKSDSNVPVFHDGAVPYLYFPSLEETGIVAHCFTTRLGGISKDIFSSLNLSFTRGDDRDAVTENYRRLAKELHCDINDFVCSDQTHTTNVRLVTAADKGIGVTRPKPYRDVDGLITNEPGLVLSTFYADCVPLYFVDPVHKAIGLSHSGWRGTVARMGKATLNAMADAFGTKAEDVIAAIGPSICQDCYEVSADVADEFALEFAGHESEVLVNTTQAGRVFSGRVFSDRGTTDSIPVETIIDASSADKFQLNLWRANELVLLDAGILPEHLSVTGICTCCNPTLLFSHRASHGKRGNLGAFMYLK